jgi:hypothetical protein
MKINDLEPRIRRRYYADHADLMVMPTRAAIARGLPRYLVAEVGITSSPG